MLTILLMLWLPQAMRACARYASSFFVSQPCICTLMAQFWLRCAPATECMGLPERVHAGWQAYGGIRHLNGYPDRAPVRANISLGDSLAGLHGAFGAVMALLHRQRGGHGTAGQASDQTRNAEFMQGAWGPGAQSMLCMHRYAGSACAWSTCIHVAHHSHCCLPVLWHQQYVMNNGVSASMGALLTPVVPA